MMKSFDEQEGKYLDQFYGESETESKSSNEKTEFAKKLKLTSEKLEVLNMDTINFHIDIMGIVERADEIRRVKRLKIELALFLITGLLILGFYGFLGLRLGYKFILTSQIVLMFIIPWVIVPITIKRRKGSEI
jgi:hypothetical protein